MGSLPMPLKAANVLSLGSFSYRIKSETKSPKTNAQQIKKNVTRGTTKRGNKVTITKTVTVIEPREKR